MKQTAIDTIMQSIYIMYPISGAEIFHMIARQDQDLKEPLSILMEYGSFDIVAVIMETVDRFFPQETALWFSSLLQTLPHADFVRELHGTFHADLVSSHADIAKIRTFDPDGFWANTIGNYLGCGSLLTLLAQTLDKHLTDQLAYSNACIGLGLSCLNAKPVTQAHIEYLSQTVFPHLISTANRLQKQNDRSSVVFRLISSQLKWYVSYLGMAYSRICDRSLETILNTPPTEMARMSGAEYRQQFLPFSESWEQLLYVDRDWIRHLQSLISLTDRLNFNSNMLYDGTCLSQHLPLLWQLLDEDAAGCESLIQCFKSDPLPFHERNLLLFYRAILHSPDADTSQRLANLLQEAYTPAKATAEYLNFLDDVISYFSFFFNAQKKALIPDIPGFSNRQSEELLEGFLNDTERWTYVNLFKEDTIIQHFRSYRQTVAQASSLLQVPDDAFCSASQLFSSISSHWDTYPRINIDSCSRVLGLTPPPEVYAEFDYKPGPWDAPQVENLAKRCAKIMNSLPSQKHLSRCRQIVNSIEALHQDSSLFQRGICALQTIQRDHIPDTVIEDNLNDRYADLLAQTYGLVNVRREDRQGASATGKNRGEVDITLYVNQQQFALIESVKLTAVDTAELTDHLGRLIVNYNPLDVPFAVLTVFAQNIKDPEFETKVVEYVRACLKENDIICDFVPQETTNTNLRVYIGTYLSREYRKHIYVFIPRITTYPTAGVFKKPKPQKKSKKTKPKTVKTTTCP